jgi:transcription elongation factor Elf1
MEKMIETNDHVEPCPFCGNAVEVIQPWVHSGASHCGSITCKHCGYSIGWHFPFIEEVWNKRIKTN